MTTTTGIPATLVAIIRWARDNGFEFTRTDALGKSDYRWRNTPARKDVLAIPGMTGWHVHVRGKGDFYPDTVAELADILVAVGYLPTEFRSEPETPEEYLVWSHDAQAWWGPNGSGYRGDDRQAGRYTREAAEQACRMRTWAGKTPPEVMVLRPSAAVMASADAEKVLLELIRAETKRRIAERGPVPSTTKPRHRSLSELIAAANAEAAKFNAEFPPGTPVEYWSGVREGDGKIGHTKGEAFSSNSGQAVVFLDNASSYHALTHVKPLAEVKA